MKDEKYNYTLSKFSHEVRNPVTLINSFLQLMVQDHPEVATYNYYDKIEENMTILRSLLDELTDYNHAANLCKDEINLYLFLVKFTESAREMLKKDGIDLVLQKESAIPRIKLDPVKMNQLFSNLIRNAAEAIAPNEGRITISLTCDGDNIDIKCSDNGCGITQEQMDTIFHPFVTYKKDGNGLGLAICEEIMKGHNGSISVISVPEEGTEFTLHFPIS
ncbi:two-component system sensor histidine kinase NtrB [Novisyntrophococcus fermenticellae]|uniref:two-component system sensor histidine kinase NtrB n=1 Tax=Novisyntrophococcus fermenticellae TaxID=2068655 RepID=UPI001E64C49B|nr:HAMP domain-containing sensor histidine kinase [Novisyntrophococcus fermenticellae]